jgi:hypothetical protein
MLIKLVLEDKEILIESPEAEIYGPFVVHHFYGDTGWQVTHIASGHRVIQSFSLEGSIAFCEEWLRQGLPLEFSLDEATLLDPKQSRCMW